MAKEVEKKQGVTTRDEGVYIPKEKRDPYDPANLHRSKAEFIAEQNKRREREAKHAELDAELDKGKAGAVSNAKVTPDAPIKKEEAPIKKAVRGRPRKIE